MTSPRVVNICGRKWAEQQEQWTANRRFIFLFPSSRASRSCRAPREISRSPRLAHKAPVMQAIQIEMCIFWRAVLRFRFIACIQIQSRVQMRSIKDAIVYGLRKANYKDVRSDQQQVIEPLFAGFRYF